MIKFSRLEKKIISNILGLSLLITPTILYSKWTSDINSCLKITKSYENNLWIKKKDKNSFYVNSCIAHYIKRKVKKDPWETRFWLITSHIESNFNPNAKGKSGEIGILQIMPNTAKMVGLKNPINPKENIDGGIKYGYIIDQEIRKYCGNIPRDKNYYLIKSASYNAGTRWLRKKNISGKTCDFSFLPKYTKEKYIKKFKNYQENYSYYY